MIKIQKFIFNPFTENTYLVWDEISKESIIIDPGCFSDSEKKRLADLISSNDLSIKSMILTHAHIDHILGCNYIKKNYSVEFYMPEGELPLLNHAEKQAEMFDLSIETPPLPDHLLNEKLELGIGDYKLIFLSTPGHTPDEYCIYFEKEKICFTGDVLFQNSIGRTDLWGGNYNQLMDSIKNKLMSLSDDIKIYPGHGNESTIGFERLNNTFLNN